MAREDESNSPGQLHGPEDDRHYFTHAVVMLKNVRVFRGFLRASFLVERWVGYRA